MQLSKEAKVGGVTIVALLLLAVMIMQLGGYSFTEKGYHLRVQFSQVGGLKQGNVVRYAGVDVGKVAWVRITSRGVEANLTINSGIKIPGGSIFSISSEGLLGEKYVSITPPSTLEGDPLAPGTVLKGEELQGLDQLMVTADKVLLDVQRLVRSMNDVLGDEQVKKAIKDTAINSRELTANLAEMSAVLARISQAREGDISATVANLAAMSASLRDMSARVDSMVENMDNNGQTAKDVTAAIHNLRATSERVEKMAASLEGVVTDPETNKNLRATLRNAREASEKANRLLGKVGNIKTQASAELLHSTGGESAYRTNLDLRVDSGDNFAVVGVSGLGDDNAKNLQFGRQQGALATRVGVVESKAGIGVDARLGEQLRLSVDAYDPNDIRFKLRSEFKLAPETYLVGESRQSNNENKDRNTYIGVRQNF